MIDAQELLQAPDVKIPKGEVMLGAVNPSELTRAEFDHADDLLWHGSAEDFEFKREMQSTGDNGQTAGVGFYLTDSEQEAKAFSAIRLNEKDLSSDKLIAKAFLPYNAKMYDFRDKNDLSRNAHVSESMLDGFRKYYQEYVKRSIAKFQQDDPISTMHVEMLQKYGVWLESIVRNNKKVDMRELLDGGDPLGGTFFGARAAFTQFMMDQGFDGVVIREGGDSTEQRQRSPVSYVFYNLDKIGTYDTYHPEVE